MTEKQISFFDEWSQKYLLNNVPQYINMLKKLFEATDKYVTANSVKVVADLGTGTGIIPILIAKKYPKVKKITALDISKEMLKVVKKRWESSGLEMIQLELVQSDFEALSLNQKYDLVTASFSLHHIPHNKKTSVLKSINKILKTEGHLLIGETMFESQGNKFIRLFRIGWIYINKAMNGFIHAGWSQCVKEIVFYTKIIKKEGEYMATKKMWEQCLKDTDFIIKESKFINKRLTYGYIIAQKNERTKQSKTNIR